jgi:hypothetical protein
VRACGIELPASEQIEQVAEAILSAGVLHTLGEQQTARLTEVLHYLEHRVDRMLDNQLAAAAGGEPAPATVPPRAKAHDADPLVSPAPDFPLAMVDMTAANTNDAEPAPAWLPIVEHSAQDIPTPVATPTAASPVELPTSAVVSQAAVPPAMDVAQQTSPAAVLPTTPAPEPAVSAPAIAPLAVAPEPAPAARASDAIAPKAAPEAITAKATAPTPAASEVTAAAPPLTVSRSDQPVAVVPDAIAAQVDDDLNELTDFAAPETTPEDDPADFLLEAPPTNAASAHAADKHPTTEMAAAAPTVGAPTAGAPTAGAPTTGAKVATAQMSTVLAAIATELLTNGIPETQAQPLATSGALAAVMAMSEEERIALFS